MSREASKIMSKGTSKLVKAQQRLAELVAAAEPLVKAAIAAEKASTKAKTLADRAVTKVETQRDKVIALQPDVVTATV